MSTPIFRGALNIPTAINRASRVPTANERARFRRSSGFDPAPFCAAPRPNQKRSLSIAVSAVIGAALWRPYYACDYGELPYSASAKSPNPDQGYLADGAANGSAGVNSAPNADAGVNSAADLGGQRCGDHEDRGDSSNYRKLAQHKICYLPSTCSTAFMTGTLKFFSS